LAKGPRYRVKFRRRREGKTDYRQRLALVKSGKPRLVVRVRSKNTVAQVINFDPKGDKCMVTGTSVELRKLGYKGNTSNVPAAYLTGVLCATKAKKAGIKEAVLDLGIETKSRRIFAVLKGAVDAGIKINHGKIDVPDEMIKGKHISTWATKAADPQFKAYKGRGLDVSKMEQHVETIKGEITKRFSS
jgi:large subunit ribosomal protein L18